MNRLGPAADELARRRTLREANRCHQLNGAVTLGHWCARPIIKTAGRVCRRRVKIAHSLATARESLRVGNEAITRSRHKGRYSILKSGTEPATTLVFHFAWNSDGELGGIGSAAHEPHRPSSRVSYLSGIDTAGRLSRRNSACHAQHVLAVKFEVAPLAFRECTNVYATLGIDAHALQ